MKKLYIIIASFLVLSSFTACSDSNDTIITTLNSGVALENMDSSVRPQDDFYTYVNGTWLQKTEIPSDSSAYSAFTEIYDKTQLQLKEIVVDASENTSAEIGSDEKKIGDLYTSYMDEERLNSLGITPLENLLTEISGVSSNDALITLMAKLYTKGSNIPFGWDVWSDSSNSTQNIVYVMQSGLGLPDRDYYVSDDPSFVSIRSEYKKYIADLMALAGFENSEQIATDILILENKLALEQWSKEENRDVLKTYNKLSVSEIDALMSGFDFKLFSDASNFAEDASFIVMQPSYLQEFAKTFDETSISIWQEYFSFHLINSYAEYLSGVFNDLHFLFYETTLRGIEEQKPRWEYGINLVDAVLGEMLGKLYVEKNFSPEAKERMDILVDNLITSYDTSIENLTWMSATTKVSAKEKLHKISRKIAYPESWKDYSALDINAEDLVGNVIRHNEWYYEGAREKLLVPVDKSEWFMTPQTVNAYYDPSVNTVVFPAAILQAPFFDMNADDAVNYGAIGSVIGHELSHAFDDMGSKYDGDGNLNDWWSESDAKAFKALGDKLVAQYSKYEPVEGHFINGQLTLGENMADLSGVSISYDAYMLSLENNEAVTLDGFTAEQRFFIGWAQIWRINMREEEKLNRLVTDPHSPGKYRVLGVFTNVDAFYDAFDVQEGDAMYMDPANRVKIW